MELLNLWTLTDFFLSLFSHNQSSFIKFAKHLPLSGNPEFVMGHREGGRGGAGEREEGVSCHADLASEAQRVLEYCINERFYC